MSSFLTPVELLKEKIFTAAEQGDERHLFSSIEALQLLLQEEHGEEATIALENSLNYVGRAAIGDTWYTTTATQCTPLIIAINNNHIGCVKVLLLHLHQSSSVNKTDKNGHGPLYYAAKKNLSEIISLLVEWGADVNHHANGGFTALMWAVKNKNVKDISLLLEHGAVVDICGRDSALMIASRQNSADLATLLLEHGADPNLQNQMGDTALHIAVCQGNVDTVAVLLKHGANADLCSGDSALMISTRNKHTEIVSLLLAHGATVSLQNACGETAMHFAARGSYRKLFFQLFQHSSLRGGREAGCWRLRRNAKGEDMSGGGGNEIALSLITDPWMKARMKRFMLAELWWLSRKNFLCFCAMLLSSCSCANDETREQDGDINDDKDGNRHEVVLPVHARSVRVFLVSDLTRFIAGFLGPSCYDITLLEGA